MQQVLLSNFCDPKHCILSTMLFCSVSNVFVSQKGLNNLSDLLKWQCFNCNLANDKVWSFNKSREIPDWIVCTSFHVSLHILNAVSQFFSTAFQRNIAGSKTTSSVF